MDKVGRTRAEPPLCTAREHWALARGPRRTGRSVAALRPAGLGPVRRRRGRRGVAGG